ncbi:glycerate kinase [Flammeovirga kamogawensis]|uniref:Glycerate kinase n=1 Tax=Flammeovirga kamogawensis TaxID=373891 RepID=A0ABX8GWT6_9BACT|nr:glycerate kinase [Flammeovirga kamogawensis]MBB6460714.1 glycerate kinase [Flammeovirga kamogawensis]QWG08068.1 glycerate kinase [Flammeovirga kamogawensis]
MKIVITPNAFKNSLSANEAAQIIRNAWYDIRPKDTIISKPITDGGDGFSKILSDEKDGKFIQVETKNAIGNTHTSGYVKINNATAVIELAQCCGLQTLTKENYDALESSTEGLGIVINQALEDGCTEFIIGLGGSASTDLGLGALYALGVKFLTFEGKEIRPKGKNLDLIQAINYSTLSTKIKNKHFYLAVDVKNTLLGKNGAAKTFAPQKGASKTEIDVLEYNLSHASQLIHRQTGKDVQHVEGGGAAGGTAAGFWAFLNAEIMDGSQFIMEVLGLHEAIDSADLIITTEGCLDEQSLKGKAPYAIAQYAEKKGKLCIAFVGNNNVNHINNLPFYTIFSINPSLVLIDEAINKTAENLKYSVHQFAKVISITNK